MAKYFFKIHGSKGFIEHSKGDNFRYFAEALDEAKASARELAFQLLDDHESLANSCVEVTDENGKVLAALPVSEVLTHPNFPVFKGRCGETSGMFDQTSSTVVTHSPGKKG